MYLYFKSLHIIFVITWFAGLFYAPRLLIYLIEANEKPANEKSILQKQLNIMFKRLWFIITWPSAILTLIFGTIVTIQGNWYLIIFEKEGKWFLYKIILIIILYGYHFSLHYLYKKSLQNQYPYTSQQIRYWNEIPTVLLLAIVFLVVIKQEINYLGIFSVMILFIIILIIVTKLYKKYRKKI